MLFFEQETMWSERKEHYEMVAHGEFDSLEEAWEATQNITHSWTRNEKVHTYRDQIRSTSVEDVLLVETDEVYQVATVGFQNIADGASSKEVDPYVAEHDTTAGDSD